MPSTEHSPTLAQLRATKRELDVLFHQSKRRIAMPANENNIEKSVAPAYELLSAFQEMRAAHLKSRLRDYAPIKDFLTEFYDSDLAGESA